MYLCTVCQAARQVCAVEQSGRLSRQHKEGIPPPRTPPPDVAICSRPARTHPQPGLEPCQLESPALDSCSSTFFALLHVPKEAKQNNFIILKLLQQQLLITLNNEMQKTIKVCLALLLLTVSLITLKGL